MEALIGFLPAGGQSSRLTPHTYETPKPMLPMGSPERRLIDLPLETLQGNCRHTFITTSSSARSVESYVGRDSRITVLRDEITLGNAGSLIQNYSIFSDLDAEGSMLIVPGDHVFDNFSVHNFYETHKERGADVTLMATSPKPYGEYVDIQDGFAKRLVQELGPATMSTTGIFIVKNRYVIEWARRHKVSGWSGEPKNITADLINPGIQEGRAAIFPLSDEGYWDDAGTPRRYLNNNMRLSSGQNVISHEALVDPQAYLRQCVILGDVALGPDTNLYRAIVSARHDLGSIITHITKVD